MHECGLIAEPGDAAELAARIRTFHQDRQLTKRAGENARRAGLSFDRRSQVAKYMAVFRDVTRETSATAAAVVADRQA
jgi:glycosyltransferase involved in cell wall biosynthesis